MNGNCGECERRYYCQIDPAECDNLSGPVTMTNADKIRAMTDEELVEIIYEDCCDAACAGNCHAYSIEICKAEILKWLQQPAEEDT